jgi:DNA-3-methyladenine glycosylase II
MAATEATPDATVSIEPVAPFDFAHSLAFLDGFIPCAGDHQCSTGVLTTGGYADDDPFVARIADDEAGSLAVDVDWIDGTGNVDAVEGWIRSFLSLDDDLTDLYQAAEDDAAFGRVVDDLRGYHHVRFSTPYEAACWAALSQRTPMRVAKGLKRSLVELCGQIVERDGEEILLFPTPEMVHDAGPAVGDIIEHDRKTKTILAAAEAFTNEDLASLNDDTLQARLEDVWGFGDWSSEFVTLRGFGRLSGIPRTERRLREAVADLYGLDEARADDGDLDRLSAPYRPMEGYWAHYIRVWAFRQTLDS